jgi:hypothetical protein
MNNEQFKQAIQALLAELQRNRYAHLIVKPVLSLPARSK